MTGNDFSWLPKHTASQILNPDLTADIVWWKTTTAENDLLELNRKSALTFNLLAYCLATDTARTINYIGIWALMRLSNVLFYTNWI